MKRLGKQQVNNLKGAHKGKLFDALDISFPLSGKGNFSAFMADAQRNPFTIGPAYDMLWQSVEHAIKFSQVLTWRPVLVLKHVETIDWS